MNKLYINTIFKALASGIDMGYKSGIKSIVKQNKKNFAKENVITFSKKKKMFDVDYTATDKEALHNFKINAFKVAGVGSFELQEELKKIAVKLQTGEITDSDSYELAVRQKMLQYGIGLGDQPPSGWLKQNLDHAIKSSIAGARWNRVTEPELQGVYVAWEYHTQEDDAVRPEHQVLDGLVFAMDDPAGARMIPPNDYGCRCYEDYLTEEEAADKNILSGHQSKSELNKIPEDFRFNPGIEQDIWGKWLNEKLDGMPGSDLNELKSMVKDKFGADAWE